MPEPDGGTSRAAFQIAYDGPATAAHSMDVQLLGAACKTLIDSERRKNTQASSDVGARQLARF